MLSVEEKIVFAVVALSSFVFTFRTFNRMIRIINRGADQLYFDHLPKRIWNSLSVFISQRTVFTNRFWLSLIHALIAWAFIMYFLVNLGDVLRGFIPEFHFMGRGAIGNFYRLFVDVFSALALVGVLYFLVRRFILKVPALTVNDQVMLHPKARRGIKRDSLIVGLFIFLHVGFRLLGESFYLSISGIDAWQPVASALAGVFSTFNAGSQNLLMHISWWLAIGLILAFIPYFPSSKHAHLFMGPINYLTRPNRSAPGTLERIDFEAEDAEQFGVANLEHLDKTQILDAYACIMCNRCQDVCPAYVTGKELSPSAVEINKRYYINGNAQKLADGNPSEASLLSFVLSESAMWACTSCAACVEICPVGNEPMYDILNMRRDRVLMDGKFPNQLQNAFNGMERNGNPWNMNKDRLEWVKEDSSIIVKTTSENLDFDVLFWVGCAGAFDQKGQQIARSFAKILNKAEINFAILGNDETCTGDSARRSGNEYLFAMLAEKNVETLNKSGVRKIVTTCPHCLHTLKNEYPQFGGQYEVTHHSQFIEELIRQGKIKLNTADNAKITFHDPCYLGRHNDITEAPRYVIHETQVEFTEMDRIRNRSFCCGAGGGNMWKEEEHGQEAVRRERFREAESTGAELICTGCPFCMTMLRDAGKELESSVTVHDIAELVAEQLV
jgi:Fe-S oxidoreductase